MAGTVCYNCGDQATCEHEGLPMCSECFNWLMLEICSSYADMFLERQIVRQPQPEVSDQDSPF